MSLKIGVCMDFFFQLSNRILYMVCSAIHRKPFQMYKYNLLENMFIEADSIIS